MPLVALVYFLVKTLRNYPQQTTHLGLVRRKTYKAEIVNCFSHLGSVRGERNQVLKEERGAVWWKKEDKFGAWGVDKETSKPTVYCG